LKSSDKADALAVLCDVGQGTAFVMRVAAHSAFVVDVGPEPALIDDCLHEMGINDIPLLILSHFHSDHVGGLSGALHGRRVGLVLVSPLAAPPQGAHIVTETLRSHGVVAHIASAGERLASGPTQVDVLTPTQLLDSVASPPNDDCLAVAITTRVPWRAQPIRVLAPCDLEYAGQEQLLRTNPGLPGNFDIAVVPHHGSSKQLEEFAHWAHPRIALIPVGRHNDYGHPAHTALSLWADRGLTALGRTDANGDLVISRCGPEVCLRR
jgi:competence protein ComEC